VRHHDRHMKSTHERTISILYGSETGNAKDVAEQLGRGVKRMRFAVKVMSMNDFPFVGLITKQRLHTT